MLCDWKLPAMWKPRKSCWRADHFDKSDWGQVMTPALGVNRLHRLKYAA